MMRGIAPTAGRVPVATSDTVELSTATRTRAPIGGSKSDRFNNTLIAAAVSTGWFPPGQSDEDRSRQVFVAVTGLQGSRHRTGAEFTLTP